MSELHAAEHNIAHDDNYFQGCAGAGNHLSCLEMLYLSYLTSIVIVAVYLVLSSVYAVFALYKHREDA